MAHARNQLVVDDPHQVRISTGITDAQMLQPLETAYERVVALAKAKPSVTGDYNLLCAYYWWTYYRRTFGCEFKRLLELPSPETITRAFRKAVENGDVQPSAKILKRREQRERVVRHAIRKLGAE